MEIDTKHEHNMNIFINPEIVIQRKLDEIIKLLKELVRLAKIG